MAEGNLLSRLLRMKILGASILGALVIFIGGIVFWGAFNTAMEATNKMDFCVSCHEMDQLVYPEYQTTIHYQNRTGVQATCPDCHVPRPWIYKMIRKIQASKEVLGWMLGSYDTMEEFEAHRLTMAKSVWKAMKETDSRECRNCHSWDAMTDKKQKPRAWKQHQNAKADGMTCIDCHKGIAHRNVHHLIEDEETFYDGKPNPARLDVLDPREEAKRIAAEAAAKAKAEEEAKAKAMEEAAAKAKAAAEAAAQAGGSAGGSGDAKGVAWDAVAGVDVPLLYPGQASLEWVFRGKDHGGARAVSKTGDRCADCHKKEVADMGKKIVGGEKAEATPIPGKAGSMKMNVKAANDGNNLYMRFEWASNPHTPVPFVDGGKMDKENQFKLAMMINSGKSELADQAGCWATCHHDSRYMPDAPEKAEGDAAARLDVSTGITKYLNETRTEFEYKGRGGKKRGAWDKLKSQEEIDALLKDGLFLDLLRYNSGTKKSEDGHVLEQRVMSGGQGVSFIHEEVDGKNVVYMTRKLTSDKAGDVSLEAGKLYKVGFAIHDDFTNARFHHVSIDWYLGLNNADADINAVSVAAPAGGSASTGEKAASAPAAAATGGSVNWAGVSPVKVPMFYPGQASMEWIFRGKDHGGARAVSKTGDRCFECHGKEQTDMGKKLVTGEKAEATPIPGKTGFINAEVKAAHDASNVYFQVSWKDTGENNAAPFVDGGKMDKDNQVKLAMMVSPVKEEFFGSQGGCWATCHHDSRYMPDTPEKAEGDAAARLDVSTGITKYLNETRTEFEYKGRGGKKRGAWDKLKSQEEIDALLKDGTFLDLMRFKSGNGGQFENGYVLEQRVMGKGVDVTGQAELKDGVWTVTMQRPLMSSEVGDISFEPGKEYLVGFAIHDDHTNARFHHVSLEYKLALDNPEAQINAAVQ